MDVYDGRHERDGDPVFFEVLTGVARKSSSGLRSSRLMEDVSSMNSYLKDIKICLIALTLLIYGVLIFYLVRRCIIKRRKSQNVTRRPQWDFQSDQKPVTESRNPGIQLEEMVSVRSDGQIGNSNPNTTTISSYMNRNHRSSTPSMLMRHTRLGQEVGNEGKILIPESIKSTELEISPFQHNIPQMIITSDLPHSTNNPDDTKSSVGSPMSFKSTTRKQMPSAEL